MNDLLVMLEIDGRRAVIPAADVQSVIELEAIYPVPRAPDYVLGLTAMRSQSLTVIDACLALGLSSDCTTSERAPIVDIDGHLYAIRVDKVDDVVEAQSDVTPISGGFGPGWERVARGMVETDRGPALVIDPKLLVLGPSAAAA